MVAVAVVAHPRQSLVGCRSGQGLTGAEHPDTPLLAQRRRLPDGAKRHLLARRFEVKLVSGLQVQLVAQALRYQDASSTIERKASSHFIHNIMGIPACQSHLKNEN